MRASKRDWMFRVEVNGLAKNEAVYVVGNISELGTWDHTQAIQLQLENSGSNSPEAADDSNGGAGDIYDSHDSSGENLVNDEGKIFSQKIELPSDVNVEFRYFIAVDCQSYAVKNSTRTLIIRRWETHMKPRLIKKDKLSNLIDNSLPEPDQFGYNSGYFKVEKGWLVEETVIQFKIFNNPIKLWKNGLKNRKVHIKMTPVNLVRHNSLEIQQFGSDCVEDSLSMDTQDIIDQPVFSITEIAVMNEDEAHFKHQEQFGREYNEDDFTIFNVTVRHPDIVAYLVDYYVYSSRSCPGEPPNHIGFSYILPSTLQASVGMVTVPITSTKHRPIGQLTVEYVAIRPIVNQTWDMSISYAKHWEERWSGLDVGHRGLGTSFKFEMENCANVRENTIASLKTAAYHGADMVEFDVQLSKDFIPVIYHDFHVSISLKRKKQIEAMDMLEIPVKDLTLEQLHLLKDFYYPGDSLSKVLYFIDKDNQGINQLVYHLAEGREKTPKFFDEDLEDHQPFPTLQSVLQVLEQHVGCNIEIKWTMQLKDGSFELNHPFDLNVYLDVILKVVLEYGCDRKIVFSSFNPDICAMIRLKQNKYPVVFLTQGVTAKYPMYHDTRCQTIPMAIRHALAADILGINVHTEDILRDASQVKLVRDAGLIIFCWGDDNNDKDTIQHLKKLGLHGVIYDKIDEYNVKEVKESIFLVDARENQKDLIALANCSQTCGPPQHTMPASINSENIIGTLEPQTNNNSESDRTFSLPISKMPNECKKEQDKEMGDLTKDFSVCAKSFGQTLKMKSSEVTEAQTDKEIQVEDDSAKDCL